MNVLFIDTHSERVTIEVLKGDRIYQEKVLSNRSHSEVLVSTLERVLNSSELDIRDIDLIIVVIGPGSFTGVRMGVTVAKTIAYCLDIKIKTITSLEAYGISSSLDFDLVTVEDSKGVYSALKKDGQYKDYFYQKRSEFEKYKLENNLTELSKKEIDLKKIVSYLEDCEPVDVHLVNPIYIKEIDALK